jgi:hypothetical protein
MHEVGKLNLVTGAQYNAQSSSTSFTSIFANALINAAIDDRDNVGIIADQLPCLAVLGMDIFGPLTSVSRSWTPFAWVPEWRVKDARHLYAFFYLYVTWVRSSDTRRCQTESSCSYDDGSG